MATVQQFEDLHVWQDARSLVREIYQVTKQPAFRRDFGLRDQITRAATSTMSNRAEGSNGEVRSQLYVALDQEYLEQKTFEQLHQAVLALSRRTAGFITYLEVIQKTHGFATSPTRE